MKDIKDISDKYNKYCEAIFSSSYNRIFMKVRVIPYLQQSIWQYIGTSKL